MRAAPRSASKTLTFLSFLSYPVENPDPFATFLGELEPKLSLCGLDIKTTRNQETGKGLYVLVCRSASFLPSEEAVLTRFLTLLQVNTIQDDPAKLATEYKPEEIALFKAIVRLFFTLRCPPHFRRR